ncbi:MAG: transglutaminase domain-containing protein [Verrucomicrobiota bacterium]
MLNTPPLLLSATLIFWGWQTGLLWVGLLLGAVLEGSRLVKHRWEFANEEFNQLWTLTTLAFVAVAAYALATNEGVSAFNTFFNANSFAERNTAINKAAKAVLNLIQWMPMLFFPFTAAQAFSQREKIDFKTFSWVLRRRAAKIGATASVSPGGLNTAYPYFGITLVSASTTAQASPGYYLGLCALMGWALWPMRSRRAPVWAWLLAVVLASGLGFAGHKGIYQLYFIVNNLQAQWLQGFGAKGFDPKESRTAMGQIGRLKGSGRIVLRVEAPAGERTPTLLRQAIYQYYQAPYWRASSKNFDALYAETNETSWVFHRAPASNTVQIATYLDDGKGLLSLPTGTHRLERLPVFQMETNSLGTVRVGAGPGLVIFNAKYQADATFDGNPTTEDYGVPEKELPAIRQLVAELKLAEGDDTQKVRKLERFFARYFDYGFWEERDLPVKTNQTILTRFLLDTRKGHCEFFASATVLLLRQAGVAARYTAGYSVQEGAGGNRFVVRDRHAHAWCLYYDRAAHVWRDLDTTPGTWVQAEAERRSLWEPIKDGWDRLVFEFSKVRWGQSALQQYLSLALIPVVILLAARFLLKKRWRRQKSNVLPEAELTRQGLDSEFYRVEERLAARGLNLLPGETLSAWLGRVDKNLPPEGHLDAALLQLHYRLRFDPVGLSTRERDQLRQGVMEWLKRMDRNPKT